MDNWKFIPGYNDVYQVNNNGVVRSLDHYPKGRSGGRQNGKVLKQQKCYKGYSRVSLSKDGVRFVTGVHRLVAMAFIPNPESKDQVNHINGVKDDNRVENLEWCTNSENQKHAVRNNLTNPNYGEKHHMSKLTNLDAKEIRIKRDSGESVMDLAKEYSISNVSVHNIINHKTYNK